MLSLPPLKTLFQANTGLQFKMGRRLAVARAPRLSFRNYLRRDMPTPPATCDYSLAALSCLRNILGNDRWGDCVIAGYYHVKGLWTGGVGKLWTPTLQQVSQDYHTIGGPGDNGCNEQDALNYWTSRGDQNGSKLLGYLNVNARDPVEMRLAIYLFMHLYYGTAMPDKWVNPMPQGDGFIWDVAGRADPSNGHCYMAYGYDDRGPKIDTWGMFGTTTWACIAAYNIQAAGGELYCMLSKDMIDKATSLAPNGIDWSQLVADFDSLGGNVPIPPPIVPPIPVPPVPPIPPTPVPIPPIPVPPVPVIGPSVWLQFIQWLIQFLSSKEAPDMTSWFSVFLHIMMSLLTQFGPKALPWIESLVNASSLTPAQKAIIIAILEQVFPAPTPTPVVTHSAVSEVEDPSAFVARLKSQWSV